MTPTAEISTPPRADRPVGREEIIPAVLEAATHLFAERGPDAVSVREVAVAANINHALVHRHFGAKSDLVQRVVQDAATRVAEASARAVEPDRDVEAAVEALEHERDAVRLLTWALLAGHPVDSPLGDRSGAALLLGWVVFEPTIACADAREAGVRGALDQVTSS